MFESPEFWVAVGFVLLVASICRPVARSIGGMLDKRSQKIRDTLDEALRLREEAQHLLAEYQRKQRDAVRETEEMVERAMEESDRLTADATASLELALERRAQAALEKIAQAEDEALREVRETAVDVAIAATRKLLSDRLAEDGADALIDEAIADLTKKLH